MEEGATYTDRGRYFFERHAVWSQETFGTDQERGPLGALKHLEKEAVEAQVETTSKDHTRLRGEIADCLFLTFDAARRSGMDYDDLFDEVEAKFAKNKKRVWQKPSSPDQPIEHVRGIHD